MNETLNVPPRKAVVKRINGRLVTVYVGNHDECIEYMKSHRAWSDLVNLNEDGSYGRLSSWVLD